jgi:hypothetical protein
VGTHVLIRHGKQKVPAVVSITPIYLTCFSFTFIYSVHMLALKTSVVYHWNTSGIPMAIPLAYQWIPVGKKGGIPLVFQWKSTGFPVEIHWFSSGKPLVFKWKTTRIPPEKKAVFH